MTSKEALNDLFSGEIISLNSYMNLRLGIIKEDLEVLEIIKKSIFNKEEHKYVLTEKIKGQKFMLISLSIRGDDIDKVKEWIEND